MWIQGSVEAGYQAGGDTFAEAYLKLQTTVDTDVALIATAAVQVNPTVSGETSFVPLSAPFPALGLTAVMFACIVSQVDGTLNYQPAWRAISGDPTKAGNFTAIGTGQSSVTTEEDHNFGRITVAPATTDNLAQVALAYSGSTAEALISVVVAAVYG
jgi:hypothetical protein